LLLDTSHLTFDPAVFLSSPGRGRRACQFEAESCFYSQGDPADCVFYLRSGRARLTVVSRSGKEGTISIISPGDFIGEESIAPRIRLRIVSASAITDCEVLRIERTEMLRVLHEERSMFDLFMKFLLLRGMQTQAALVDRRCSSSEQRLARTLLLMAEFDPSDNLQTLIPQITQETLAEMIGVNRSLVNGLMNRFRDLGFIEYKGYNGRIRVHKSLLTNVLDA
jgi:CRP/FNR family cyclic AMP-dependent transcriptional regulator